MRWVTRWWGIFFDHSFFFLVVVVVVIVVVVVMVVAVMIMMVIVVMAMVVMVVVMMTWRWMRITMRRTTYRRRLIPFFQTLKLALDLSEYLIVETVVVGMTMWWNTTRSRGRDRDIDNRKSGFVECMSRGRGFDDRKSRFGRGYDGSCSNRLRPMPRDLMNQTLRFITKWWIGWYLDGSMSNRINLVFDIHRSSIFGSTRNTRRETFTHSVMLNDRTIIS
jgi:hypothetical protein